ncbi:winged helix-turn-helix domain-containing protein [Shewanella sp. 10N.7]|uniref:winged helix-turn-helix domain-containing protein n=1 Tax=Shewanella sp. 10N.7 TaxID=2885093 RepID=UPI001E6401E5|nr:winged helix-turn-helix domain-containing protein [Shewanella sp. 10N.7]MCC4833172.1 winged helix-turn-helix domain-containing protein [Shewanella sp. 10N.7]
MRFAFGDIIVDVEQVKITKKGEHLECEPRVFELLLFFCQRPLEAISREELVNTVWQGRIVSDAAVNRAIGELRKLIEDTPSSPQWIKTVSKVGYRFTVSPTQEDAETNSGNTTDSFAENSSLLLDNNGHKESQTETQAIAINPKRKNIAVLLLISISFLTLTLVALWGTFPIVKQSKPLAKHQLQVIQRKPLTSITGSAFNPAYHQANQQLVYLYRASSDDYAQVHLQINNGARSALTQDSFYYTDVVFGSGNLVYASRLNNLQERHCEIVQIDTISQQVTSLFKCGINVVTQLAFDSHKQRLLYQSRPSISEPYSIHAWQIDTGRKQQITHPKQFGNNLGDYTFSLSSDNRYLSVIEYDADNKDTMKLIDLDDNQLLQTHPFIDDVFGLMWRSDTELLASNSDGLFIFDITKQQLTPIEHSDQFARLAAGKNDQTILTERSQIRMNIVSYPITVEATSVEEASVEEARADSASLNNTVVKTDTVTPLTASSGINQTPVLGNQSNIMAFISDRNGERNIYIKDGKSTLIQTAFKGEIKHISAMAWTHNDKYLIASINSQLFRYSINDQRWQAIAESFAQVHHVAASENAILFSAEIDNKWNIWQLPIDAQGNINQGTASQLTTKGGYSVQANNQTVYFSKFNHPGLFQLNLNVSTENLNDEVAEKVLIDDFPIAAWRHWQLKGDYIYYLLGKEYLSLNLTNNEIKPLHHFSGRAPSGCNLAVQRNFLACDRIELSQSNIWQLTLSH